jgi:trehalose/maltose hydrolase-like predicted phosphorylase
MAPALAGPGGGAARSDDSPTWILAYDRFVPEEEQRREALTSTGNGYFCTRGSAEWEDVGEEHYPGTYVHGGYNRATTIMAGRPVVHEDLVNLPNWLVLKLRLGDDAPITMRDIELLAYRHEYDIRNALVRRTIRFRDRQGRETSLASRRFASMADMHQGAIEWTITAENWSGTVEVLSALEGRVTNWGVPRYRQLEAHHVDPVEQGTIGPDLVYLLSQTRRSHIYIAEAARTRVYGKHEVLAVRRSMHRQEGYVHEVLTFDVEERTPVRVEKMAAFCTSRDNAICEPLANAQDAVGRYGEFRDALERHENTWDQLWARCDIRIPKDDHVQRLVRFHISHVLQVCSPHTADLDAGVPARGLNGEAYRGHVFWDELYIYPFINYRLPEITRGLLTYRYRRLDRARTAARDHGYSGAMYPWQSGSDGREETPIVHFNPNSGRWDPDLSHNQRHVNAAIFYNIWQHFQITGDIEFLRDHGAAMMLEITRFWASIAHYNPARNRYEIHGVMGPDEFHEQADLERTGLPNNAYTNLMVAWICKVALEVLSLLPEKRREALCAKIGVSECDLDLWEDMSRMMYVPIQGGGIISQFEGYENLDELNWDAYRAQYGNVQRLDRILKAEGKKPDHYKAAKQADTLMLWFLFSEEVLRELFGRLGYEYEADMALKNIEYYKRRTSHGSTLSFIVHADLEAGMDPESSWSRFVAALESDVADIQGGTTQEGIHMGVMASTLDLIQRGFMGTDIRDGVLFFDPKSIPKLEGLSFPMQFRDTPIEVSLQAGTLTVVVRTEGLGRSIKVAVGDEVRDINAGESYTFQL